MLKKMLREYRRRTTIKPFAPILKDQCSKRWNSDLSISTNLSLLSVSNSSKSCYDVNDLSNDGDASSARESISSSIDNKISNTTSRLLDTNIDESIKTLFDSAESSKQDLQNDYDPRAIRPPPFAEYIKELKNSRAKIKPIQHRSVGIPVRTTKSEQLRLARQQSTVLTMSHPSAIISLTKVPLHKETRRSPISSLNSILCSQTSSNTNFSRSESTRSCKVAINSSGPLQLSSMLLKQIQEDIRSERVPTYSVPITDELLQEQLHPLLNHQYKMQRIRQWLKKIVPTDYLEYNEHASNESTLGTNSNDILDDEYDLLLDEKLPAHSERTYAEAHRLLPIFNSEIERKRQRRNLLLTRVELDLYVI